MQQVTEGVSHHSQQHMGSDAAGADVGVRISGGATPHVEQLSQGQDAQLHLLQAVQTQCGEDRGRGGAGGQSGCE